MNISSRRGAYGSWDSHWNARFITCTKPCTADVSNHGFWVRAPCACASWVDVCCAVSRDRTGTLRGVDSKRHRMTTTTRDSICFAAGESLSAFGANRRKLPCERYVERPDLQRVNRNFESGSWFCSGAPFAGNKQKVGVPHITDLGPICTLSDDRRPVGLRVLNGFAVLDQRQICESQVL
jgi:hypothetical protein